jgi:hypothetical protein
VKARFSAEAPKAGPAWLREARPVRAGVCGTLTKPKIEAVIPPVDLDVGEIKDI